MRMGTDFGLVLPARVYYNKSPKPVSFLCGGGEGMGWLNLPQSHGTRRIRLIISLFCAPPLREWEHTKGLNYIIYNDNDEVCLNET